MRLQRTVRRAGTETRTCRHSREGEGGASWEGGTDVHTPWCKSESSRALLCTTGLSSVL